MVDEELLARLRDGGDRERIFHLLYERHYGSAYCFFLRQGCSREESRDLAQETFLRLFKGLAGFEGRSSFRTWLFKIAGNIWRNELRSRSARKREAEEVSFEASSPGARRPPEEPAAGVAPLAVMLEVERSHLLRRALEDLPPQMRRCMTMRLDHGWKYREIAEVMQISIETVKSQVHQARQKLKRALGDYLDESP